MLLAAAELGIDAYAGAPLWRMHPGELARRLAARRAESDLRDFNEWLRHAQTLAFHANSSDEPVTVADVMPSLFGPEGRWPLGAGEDAEDVARETDDAVAAMVERRRAKAALDGGPHGD